MNGSTIPRVDKVSNTEEEEDQEVEQGLEDTDLTNPVV